MEYHQMTEQKIKDVSDTAFMIASYRALETERRDALFLDPLAGRLAGEFGRNIVARLPRISRMTAWSVAIRTRIIDELILDSIEQGVDIILNLGAGLDTRPYRLPLPETLTWIEADYPKIIELKQQKLASERPLCRLEQVKVDLSDLAAREAMLADVNNRKGKVLVLLEGVIPYLEEEAVAHLINELRSQGSFHYLITDYFSPEFLRLRERSAVKQGMENAPWRFSTGDFWGFFQSYGWRAKEVLYLFDESRRLNRKIPYPLVVKIFLKLTRFAMPHKKREEFRQFLAYVLFEAA